MNEPIDIRSVLEESIEKEENMKYYRRKMTHKQLAEVDEKMRKAHNLRKSVLRWAIGQYLNRLVIKRLAEWRELMIKNAKNKIISYKIGKVPISYNPWFEIGIPWHINITTLDRICDEILPGFEQQVYTLISPDVELVWIMEDDGITIHLEIKDEAYKEVIRKVKERHTED